MAFLLDPDKVTSGSIVQTTEDQETVIYDNEGNTAIEIGDNGGIVIGESGVSNEVRIEGSLFLNFTKLEDTDTLYNISNNDYIVEVVSTTYTDVQLPTDVDEGRSIIIIRAYSNTTELNILAPPGGFIDDVTSCSLTIPGSRMQLVCNGNNRWYII
jgi:hypothetical protein